MPVISVDIDQLQPALRDWSEAIGELGTSSSGYLTQANLIGDIKAGGGWTGTDRDQWWAHHSNEMWPCLDTLPERLYGAVESVSVACNNIIRAAGSPPVPMPPLPGVTKVEPAGHPAVSTQFAGRDDDVDAAKDQCRTLIGDLRGKCEAVVSAGKSCGSPEIWKGEASNTFNSIWDGVKPQLDDLLGQLDTAATYVETSSGSIQEGDRAGSGSGSDFA